jgi:GTP-binding protein
MGELKAHSKTLATRPQVVVLTKIEGLPQDGIDQQIAALKKVVPARTKVFAMSSQAHIGTTEVLRTVKTMVAEARKKAAAIAPDADTTPIIGLSATAEALAWRVKNSDGKFVVTGSKIEKFAARTNFASEPGRRRLRDIMRRMGITHELERQGIKDGDTIAFGKHGSQHLTFGQF